MTRHEPPPAPGHAPELKRVLGFGDLVLFYVVAVFAIRMVPLAASIGPSVVVLWIVALISFFLPLGLATTDLSSRFPDEGGIYVWTKMAFGEFHGFLAAWTYWTSNAVYLPSLLLFTSTQAAFVVPGTRALADDRLFLTAFSVVCLLVLLAINVRGLEAATKLHNLAGMARFATVLAIVGLGLASWMRFGSATDLALPNWVPSLDQVQDLVFLSTLAYMFAGIESGSLLGGEIRDPRRNVPRAIFVGGLLIAALYIVASLAMLAALSPGELTGLQGFAHAVGASAGRLGGESFAVAATSIVTLLVFVMTIGGGSLWLAAAGRLPFVIGLDRFLPPAFGRLHPRYGSPHVALASLAGAALFLVILSALGGAAEQIYKVLVALELVIFFIPNLYLFAALVRLRHAASPPDAIRVPGGAAGAWIAGGTGFLVTALSLVLALVPGESVENRTTFYLMVFGSLAGNLATGIALYLYGRRRAAT